MALASSRVMRSSEPVKTIVLPASGWPAATAAIGSIVTSFEQRVERGLVVRLGEEIGDRLGDHRADALDAAELLGRVRRARRGARRRRKSPKWRASRRALVSPTWRMPSA